MIRENRKAVGVMLGCVVVVVLMAATTTMIDYDTQIKNKPNVLSDTGPYATLAAACATAANRTLILSKLWTAVPTYNFGTCPMQFVGTGKIQPANSATVTFTVASAPLSQICDISLGGHCTIFGPNGIVYPNWYGAKGDSTSYGTGTDNHDAIQETFTGIPMSNITVGPAAPGNQTIMFVTDKYGGRYRLHGSIVVGPGRFITVSAPAVPAAVTGVTLYQDDPTANTIDACSSTSGATPSVLSVTNLTFDGPNGTGGTGSGAFICLGRLLSPLRFIFDSRIQNNYFHAASDASIHIQLESGYEITDNTSELGNYFIKADNGLAGVYGGMYNSNVNRNQIYGHKKAGIYFGQGDNNLIANNKFTLNGDGSANFGAIVMNSTPTAGLANETRNTNISVNEFDANTNDIVFKGIADAVGHHGIVGVLVSGNTSDFGGGEFISANSAQDLQIVGNRVNDTGGPLVVPAIELAGASTATLIAGNTVTHHGLPAQTYGLVTGAGTSWRLGINDFNGTTGRVSLAGTPLAGIIDDSLTVNGTVTATDFSGVSKTGTFTPALKMGGANVGMTCTCVGDYVMTGKTVTVRMAVVLSAKGSSTGALTVTGLPFIASTAINARFSGSMGVVSGAWVGLSAPVFNLNQGDTLISLNNITAVGSTSLDDTNVTNTSGILISFTYFTN